MNKKQKILAKKHGTPEEFERAIWDAYSQLYINKQEAIAAIQKYKLEWEKANK